MFHRKQRFDQIASTNKENIRRILSSNDHQLNSDPVDDGTFIEEILNKTQRSFNSGRETVSDVYHLTSILGSSDDLGRTYQYLIDSLSSDGNICLICIDVIQKKDAVRRRSFVFLSSRSIF